MWPFNKIFEWIDGYFERQAQRQLDEEEALFRRNLDQLWQRPEKDEDEQ